MYNPKSNCISKLCQRLIDGKHNCNLNPHSDALAENSFTLFDSISWYKLFFLELFQFPLESPTAIVLHSGDFPIYDAKNDLPSFLYGELSWVYFLLSLYMSNIYIKKRNWLSGTASLPRLFGKNVHFNWFYCDRCIHNQLLGIS